MESDSALPLQIQPGDMFAGKYRVESVLGRGGMSVVVAAWHPGLGQRVALKLLATPAEIAPESVSRFFREARAAAALRSEYSARVLDVDVDDRGRHYIVMEHLEGLDLGDFYRQEEALPIETCVGYVLHACEAIAEAHALGIIHRDLKPENLFLTHRVDGTPLIKVLDFGVSKLIHPAAHAGDAGTSTANVVLGTPHYMSPDQIRTPASIDGRSDIWSLGVILFELLTRRPPFHGETVPDVLAAVLTSDPPVPSVLRPSIPSELSAIVLRCMQKDANERWANVGFLAQALRPWSPAWALEAADRAARIVSATAMASASSISEGARPGSPGGSSAPSSEPRRRAAVSARWVNVSIGAALGAAIIGLVLTGIIEVPSAVVSGSPEAVALPVATVSSPAVSSPVSSPAVSSPAVSSPAVSSPAVPNPRASAEQQPSLLAALDASTPGLRRAPPDAEALPANPSPRPVRAADREPGPAVHPRAVQRRAVPARAARSMQAPERRPKPAPVDPLSSRH